MDSRRPISGGLSPILARPDLDHATTEWPVIQARPTEGL